MIVVRSFVVDESKFVPLAPHDRDWQEFLIEAIRDVGVGLDVHLYESLAIHAVGGDDAAVSKIEIMARQSSVGTQRARMAPSGAIFKITTMYENIGLFRQHAMRFLEHTVVPAMHWVNVTRHELRFETLLRRERE